MMSECAVMHVYWLTILFLDVCDLDVTLICGAFI